MPRMTVLISLFSCALAAAVAQAASAPPTFETTIVDGAFTFDTGELRGSLRHGGGSIGLVPMHHVPTETPLANIPGIYNHYRVFGTDHRYVESMRALPSTAERLDPRTVRAHWEAGEEHPYTLSATYVWVDAETIDLTTAVTAHEDLPDFEVFLSSYCGEAFQVTSVFVQRPDGEADFMTAERAHGVWQMFPRDDAAVALIQDGRWAYPPSPVDWAIRPRFAAPLAYRRNPASNVAIVTMARAQDCFAVSTPERGEAHYSMYFSLFGHDVAAGETVSARTRLVVGRLRTDEIVERYNAFLDSFEETPDR